MYQTHDVKDYELDMKRQEIVKTENGEVENHAGDPVVRMLKEQHKVNREAASERSAQIAESVNGESATSRLKVKPKESIKE